MRTRIDPTLSIADLVSSRTEEMAEGIDLSNDSLAVAAVDTLSRLAASALVEPGALSETLISHVVAILSHVTHPATVAVRKRVLIECCNHYLTNGNPAAGIAVGEALIDLCGGADDRGQLRRVHNMLGVLYMDAADYASAMSHLDRSVAIAREIGDAKMACAALANVVAVLKEMGLYRDALRLAVFVLREAGDDEVGRALRFQSAANGVFCAGRMRDEVAALRHLAVGTSLMHSAGANVRTRVAFEHNRAIYLIDHDDAETADVLIDAARANLPSNPVADVTLAITAAVCDCASGIPERIVRGRTRLQALHAETRSSRVHHDDVLRALCKAYGASPAPADMRLAMAYAKEHVEYTTRVKRAQLYRQFAARGVDLDPHGGERQDEAQGIGCNDELTAIHDDLARWRTDALREQLRTAAYDTAENWAVAAEFFDDQTGRHCFRVGALASALAQEIGLDPATCARIDHAARLHDIGKVGINEVILLKPGPLDPAELAAMRTHAAVGAHLLKGAKDPTLEMAAVVAQNHHEWWNGTGYPNRCFGQAIPLVARICALADVYDALTNERPYKVAWPHELAVREIRALSGTQFDPDLVPAFLRVLERYVPALAAGEIAADVDLEKNGVLRARKQLMRSLAFADA